MTIIGTPIASANVDESYIESTSDLIERLTDDPRTSAIALAEATTAQITWYLKKATTAIDSLPLKGTTYYYLDRVSPAADEQSLQFPRIINGLACDWDDAVNGPMVPEAVKKACVEEAIALYEFYSSATDQKREKLQRQGVTSYSISKLSESYKAGSTRRLRGLKSEIAYDLLKEYIAGSVRPIP